MAEPGPRLLGLPDSGSGRRMRKGTQSCTECEASSESVHQMAFPTSLPRLSVHSLHVLCLAPDFLLFGQVDGGKFGAAFCPGGLLVHHVWFVVPDVLINGTRVMPSPKKRGLRCGSVLPVSSRSWKADYKWHRGSAVKMPSD
jgi:hypothetical protein